MLEWDHLRFMLAIHRGGSMQAASLDLRVDRATVIRRLDSLEAALGARLFERRRDGCVLTRAGLDIIETVKGIEQATTALAARVSGEDKRAEGVVTVTVPEFFAVKVLCPALPRLRASHPRIAVEISTGHSFLNLARGEADIALRNRRPEHNSLVARRVGSVAIGLFAARRYLAERGDPGGDFRGHDMVLFDESLAGMPGAGDVETMAAEARVAMRSNEILPLVAATQAGAGIGYLPVIATLGEPELELVAPGIVGVPEIFLVTHRDLRSRARVRVVFDFIVRLCTELAAELSGNAVAASFRDRTGEEGFRSGTKPMSRGPSRDRTPSSRA